MSSFPPSLSEAFVRDGFVQFPGFMTTSVLQDIRNEVNAHFAFLQSQAARSQKPENFNQFECDVLSWTPCEEGNAVFCALRDSTPLQEVTEQCLGPGFTAGSSLVMWSIAQGKGQSWHQDCPPTDPNAFNLNRLFYLSDVAEDDGAIVVVPGSHRSGWIPAGGNQDSMEGEIVLTPTAGTLILLHGHVFHRVTPNVSGRPRVSVNFRAFPAGVSPSICSVGVYRGNAYDFRTNNVVPRT